MSMLRRALEEVATGKIQREVEVTIYANLVDMADLLKAFNKEHHEQWQIKIPHSPGNIASGTARVRKTIPHITGSDVVYTNTTKINTYSTFTRLEVTIPTTVDNFAQFQMLSDVGMLKDRYFFKVANSDLIIEVDMFYLPGASVGSGRYQTMCKIDIELPSINTPIPELPFLIKDVIYDNENTPIEVRNEIKKLYNEIFLTKNIHLQS